MVVRYSKLITITNSITQKPVTVLIEAIENGNRIAINTLEGEYSSTDEFERAFEYMGNSKIRSFLPITPMGARKIVDSLNEAIQASG